MTETCSVDGSKAKQIKATSACNLGSRKNQNGEHHSMASVTMAMTITESEVGSDTELE